MEHFKDNILFNDDDEFIDFAINKEPIIKRGERGELYFTFDFSDAYKSALSKGGEFYMKDDNSLVLKRQCVSYRTVGLHVEMHDSFDWELLLNEDFNN